MSEKGKDFEEYYKKDSLQTDSRFGVNETIELTEFNNPYLVMSKPSASSIGNHLRLRALSIIYIRNSQS